MKWTVTRPIKVWPLSNLLSPRLDLWALKREAGRLQSTSESLGWLNELKSIPERKHSGFDVDATILNMPSFT